MKLSKKARLKQFKTYQNAAEFALHGSEIVPSPLQQVCCTLNFISFGIFIQTVSSLEVEL